MRIIVTGANGFVGTHLCAALRRAGHTVVACARHAPDLSYHTVGDLITFDGWGDVLAGAHAVIHLAARVHQVKDTAYNPEAAFMSANVDATQRLITACETAHVKRFIFISTIAVMGYDSGDDPFDASVINPFNPYSRSKACAEQLVRDSTLDWSILRIPLVYGAGVRANFLSLMQAVKRGIPLPLGTVRNQRSVLYVENLVDAIICTLSHGSAIKKTLLIADDIPISSHMLVRELASALNVTPRLLPIPMRFMRWVAMLVGKPMLYHKLCSNLVMDTTQTNRLLGWNPPFTTQQGLRETVRHYINS